MSAAAGMGGRQKEPVEERVLILDQAGLVASKEILSQVEPIVTRRRSRDQNRLPEDDHAAPFSLEPGSVFAVGRNLQRHFFNRAKKNKRQVQSDEFSGGRDDDV
jgi:hypothetical protein